MRSEIPEGHPLRAMFRGLVEQVFQTEVGICDPGLTDYVANLLADFVHVDQIFRMRAIDGQAIRDLSEVEARAYLVGETSETERRRVINRYIGDFTLFWVGLYPETLRRKGDRLNEYLVQGKRSYGIASELGDDRGDPPATVLTQLSCEFESCAHGLNLVRSGWMN